MITAPHGQQQPFTMVDGNNTYSVFAIENGQVKIVNAKISQASIDNLMVGTSNIEPGAITKIATGSNTVTIEHGLGSPTVRVDFNFLVFYHPTTSNPYVNTVLSSSDGQMANFQVSGQNGKWMPVCMFRVMTPPPDRVSTTFTLSLDNGSNSISGVTMVASAFKR